MTNLLRLSPGEVLSFGVSSINYSDSEGEKDIYT